MDSAAFISPKIPFVSFEDTGEKALVLMHEVNIIQLPVIKLGSLLGIVTMNDILAQKDLNQILDTYNFSNKNAYVPQKAHVLEAIKIAAEFRISVVPVLDDQQKYVGAIGIESLIRLEGDWLMVREEGAVVVVEIDSRNYSVSEFARLAEAEDLTPLGLFAQKAEDPAKLLVTIKLNSPEVGGLIEALERFGYEIKSVYTTRPDQDVAKEHFDALMKYLNV